MHRYMILTDDMQTCFHSFALYYMQKKRRFMTGFLYPDINQRCKYVRITQNREQLKTVPDTAGDRNRTGTKFNPRRILSPVRLPVPPLQHIYYLAVALRHVLLYIMFFIVSTCFFNFYKKTFNYFIMQLLEAL